MIGIAEDLSTREADPIINVLFGRMTDKSV